MAATALDPTLWRAWNALGAAYDVRNDWPNAEAAYGKALVAPGANAAVVLNKFEDMNYADIAEVMGLTTKAVKSLLSRARENLRVTLKQYIYMDSETSDGKNNLDT